MAEKTAKQEQTKDAPKNAQPSSSEQPQDIIHLTTDILKKIDELGEHYAAKIKALEEKTKKIAEQLTTTDKGGGAELAEKVDKLAQDVEKMSSIYELVTKKYNPFLKKEEHDMHQQPNTPSQSPPQQDHDASRSGEQPSQIVVEDAISKKVVEVPPEPPAQVHPTPPAQPSSERSNESIAAQNDQLLSGLFTEEKQSDPAITQQLQSLSEDVHHLQQSVDTLEQDVENITTGTPMKKTTTKKREKIVKTRLCPKEKGFIFEDGSCILSLQQLANALMVRSDQTILAHVTSHGNHFSPWVDQVLGYPELAKKVDRARTKKELIKVLRPYVSPGVVRRGKR